MRQSGRKERALKKDMDKSKKGIGTKKDTEESRKRIDTKKLEAIKAFVEKSKAEGKSPDEITSAVRAKFGEDVGVWPFVPAPKP